MINVRLHSKMHQIPVAENQALLAMEAQFQHRLAGKSLRISHEPHFGAFLESLGKKSFLVSAHEDERVLAVAGAALRTVDGKNAWQLADIHLLPDDRTMAAGHMMMFRALLHSAFRTKSAFAIVPEGAHAFSRDILGKARIPGWAARDELVLATLRCATGRKYENDNPREEFPALPGCPLGGNALARSETGLQWLCNRKAQGRLEDTWLAKTLWTGKKKWRLGHLNFVQWHDEAGLARLIEQAQRTGRESGMEHITMSLNARKADKHMKLLEALGAIIDRATVWATPGLAAASGWHINSSEF